MSQQPIWKYVGHVGDRDPIAHGGGFVYEDITGVYPPEIHWFEPGSDEEWRDKGGATKLQVYRVMIEPDPEGEWWWKRLDDVASFTGLYLEALQESAKDTTMERAILYADMLHYFGLHEFDSYPIEMTEDEAYSRYAFELAKSCDMRKEYWVDNVRRHRHKPGFMYSLVRGITDLTEYRRYDGHSCFGQTATLVQGNPPWLYLAECRDHFEIVCGAPL